MSGENECSTVIPVSKNGKYVLIYPERIPHSDLERMHNLIKEWLESEAQFLLLDSGPKLVRVDEE